DFARADCASRRIAARRALLSPGRTPASQPFSWCGIVANRPGRPRRCLGGYNKVPAKLTLLLKERVMRPRIRSGWRMALGLALGLSSLAAVSNHVLAAQEGAAAGDVKFTKDIAPILQRSRETCHRRAGVAPMSLVTYEDVRPWVRSIKMKTGLGPKAGVMPPWYVEKNIGIQQFQNDPSLSNDEIAKIAKWVDAGAPRGNPAD